MKTYIGPRNFSVTTEIVFVLFSLFVTIYNVYVSIIPSARHFGGGAGPYLCIAALFLVLFVWIALQTIYFPIGVTIDEELKQLFVRYLFLSPKIVSRTDIKSYQEIYAKSRAATYYGIVLYLKNNKQILFSEINLENYIAIQIYLDAIEVKGMGQTSLSFYSYYVNQ